MERELRAIVGDEAVLTEIGYYASDLTASSPTIARSSRSTA